MTKESQINKIRHSLSHLLAMAVLEFDPKAKLGIGPTIENGFYYDFDTEKTITEKELPQFEKRIKQLIKQNLKFEKKELSKKQALDLFQQKNQPYKLELIEELQKENQPITIYKTFNPESYKLKANSYFVDLCAGPHIASTKEINPDAFKLIKVAGAYWKGESSRPMLQRIYGIAFETKKELDNYLKLQEEIIKRDHRELGRKLDLFSFHDIAPGAPFWHPNGMIVFKELEKFWRQIHDKAGYKEINTPIMVKEKVFEQSGHLKYYRENMFQLKVEDEEFFLKPMNCPEATYIYKSQIRSYKDLPLRFSEIGRLHRNELSGVLGGMFRVRQITMDDAHIFAAPDQIQKEISDILKLVKIFYKLFNFKPSFNFATKPDEAMGEPKLWEKAENALKYALLKNKIKYNLKPKDGAFYGPKIDIHIKDALGRDWQLATIQLDFQMPERFELEYIDKKGKKQRPIMIHRAIFGSFERFIGILIEHFAGALPLWLSPEQVWVLPIGSSHKKYAAEVIKELKKNNIRAELKDQNETVSKKIREAELQKIPYILVVGDKEIKTKSVALRKRDKGDLGPIKFKNFLEQIKNEIKEKLRE